VRERPPSLFFDEAGTNFIACIYIITEMTFSVKGFLPDFFNQKGFFLYFFAIWNKKATF
jgi:hypothetical protein